MTANGPELENPEKRVALSHSGLMWIAGAISLALLIVVGFNTWLYFRVDKLVDDNDKAIASLRQIQQPTAEEFETQFEEGLRRCARSKRCRNLFPELARAGDTLIRRDRATARRRESSGGERGDGSARRSSPGSSTTDGQRDDRRAGTPTTGGQPPRRSPTRPSQPPSSGGGGGGSGSSGGSGGGGSGGSQPRPPIVRTPEVRTPSLGPIPTQTVPSIEVPCVGAEPVINC